MVNILLNTVIYLLSIVLCISAHGHMKWQDAYDYIIVGGGTAGSVVAARLSEDEQVSVLVLEAGGEATDPFIRIPLTWANILSNPKLDWGYVTEPQAMSPTQVQIHWPQGKMLGGSGSNNAMFYTRGSTHDFDGWAQLGNYNWSYDAVLPYFKKSEMMLDPEFVANGYHGTNGLMKTRVSEKDAIVDELIKAGVEMGFEEIQDYHGPKLEGVSRVQTNTDERGERASTYEAFLKPVRCRRNLDLVTQAHVEKVSFKMVDGILRVNGVYFAKDDQTHFIKARREVIVCSGAIGSPSVLMRSGIGPRQHLESLGIEVISDLPVGDNLQDHVAIRLDFPLNETRSINRSKLYTFEALFDQIFTGKGPWSGARAALVYYKSKTQPSTDLFPYIEHTLNQPVLVLPTMIVDHLRKGKKITEEMANELLESENGNIIISAFVILLHSRTRGTVRLNSTDPQQNPRITYNYFSNHKDIEDMIEGIRNVQKFISTNVMQSLQAQPITKSETNCMNHVYDSDTYWECFIYNNFEWYIHCSSSCTMAPDSNGVVDDRLRVKGVSGLRVADSSIMPVITSGPAGAATIMIAEKAADMIKMDMTVGPVLPSSGCLLSNMTGMMYLIVYAAYILTCQP